MMFCFVFTLLFSPLMALWRPQGNPDSRSSQRRALARELEAECRSPKVVLDQTQDYVVKTEVKDIDGDVVATGMVYWRIGPRAG